MHKMTSSALWVGPQATLVPHNSNNLFATAGFKGDFAYSKKVGTVPSKGEVDLLLAKINPVGGEFHWFLTFGTTNAVALGAVMGETADLLLAGLVQAKANTTGIKTVGFPGPNNTTLTLQVGDKTKIQSFIGLLDTSGQTPHFKWINTIATPDGKTITLQGLAQKPNGTIAMIVNFDAADFQVGSTKVASPKPSMLVAFADHTTGAFTKVFVAQSSSKEPVRGHAIVYDKGRDIFHILGSFTKDVTIGGRHFTHPATHQRAFLIANVKPDGTWRCQP